MSGTTTRLRLRVALRAETLSRPRSSIALVSCGAARDKIVSLNGLDPAEIDRRLASAGKESR